MVPIQGGESRAPIDDHGRYSDVVHAAFAVRRKTLRNALRARFGDDRTDAALTGADIDGGRRGETLTIAEFAALTGAMPAEDG